MLGSSPGPRNVPVIEGHALDGSAPTSVAWVLGITHDLNPYNLAHLVPRAKTAVDAIENWAHKGTRLDMATGFKLKVPRPSSQIPI